MFLWRNRKNTSTFQMKKVPNLGLIIMLLVMEKFNKLQQHRWSDNGFPSWSGYILSCIPSKDISSHEAVQLTLKALITAADHNLIFYFFFSEKIMLDISSEQSVQQMIHMSLICSEAGDIFIFFLIFFSDKTMLEISCASSSPVIFSLTNQSGQMPQPFTLCPYDNNIWMQNKLTTIFQTLNLICCTFWPLAPIQGTTQVQI